MQALRIDGSAAQQQEGIDSCAPGTFELCELPLAKDMESFIV